MISCMARSGTIHQPQPLSGVIQGCVHTVASDAVDAGCVALAPVCCRPPSSTIVKVGKSLYHGGGLCPSGLEICPVFLLPSVFSPTDWCRRRLTAEESWGIFEVPHRALESPRALPPVTVWGACKMLLPGRCLEHGVRRLLSGMSGRIEGGGLLFSPLTRKHQMGITDKASEQKKKRQDSRFEQVAKSDDDASELK